MAHPSKLFTVLCAAAFLAGCGSRATGPSPPSPPEPQPASKEQPAPRPQPPGPDAGGPSGGAPPAAAPAFRAEPDVVPIRPGGEARVKLLSVPKGGDLTVAVEPPDSRLNATADRDVLTIRAGDGATGESVVTVKAGKETARVTVRVEGSKK